MHTPSFAFLKHAARQHSFRMWLMQLCVAILYIVFGLVIYRNVISVGLISLFWPGSGLALAAIIVGGKRYIWGVFVGALVFNALVHDSLWMIGGVTLANVLEAKLGAWILSRNKRPFNYLHSLFDYVRLITQGGMIAVVPTALIGSSSLLLAGIIVPSEYFSTALHWWMGDLLGIVLITPLILVWWEQKSLSVTRKTKFEALLLISFMFIAGQIIFFDWFQEYTHIAPKEYLMFLLISLVAVRLGPFYVTFILIMIAFQALLGAINNVGIFAYDVDAFSFYGFWFYMMTLALEGMIMNTYANEINAALERLKLKNSALNMAGNGIVITDASGRVEWVNNEYSRMTGYSIEDVYKHYPKELEGHNRQEAEFYQSIINTVFAKNIWRGELVSCRKDGSIYDEEMTIVPLMNERNEIVNFVAIKQDITERKQAEELLAKSEKQYRLIAEWEAYQRREQSRFLAMLTHELKNPLATINFAAINLECVKCDKIANVKSINHINAAVRDINAIIDHCVQADHIDAGHHQINVSHFFIAHLVNEITAGLNLTTRLQIAIPDSLSISSDKILFRTILSNLLDNALKYSPLDSEVSVSAIQKHTNTNQPGILISVCNQVGEAGRPDESQLFEKYYRSSSAQRQRGTGLGLWLVKGITTQLGGQIKYISHNEELEFQVWIPQL